MNGSCPIQMHECLPDPGTVIRASRPYGNLGPVLEAFLEGVILSVEHVSNSCRLGASDRAPNSEFPIESRLKAVGMTRPKMARWSTSASRT